MGLLQWVRDTVSSIYQTAQSGYTQTVEGYRTVRDFMRQDNTRTYVSNTFLQFGEGLFRVLQFAPVAATMLVGTRPKTLWVMINAQAATMKRLARVLGYHMYLKPLVANTVRSMTNENYYAETAAVGLLDILAAWYFTRKAVSALLADNVMYGNALSKTSTSESAESETGTHELMRPCKHCEAGGLANFSASSASLLHYYLNWVVLTLLDRGIPGFQYLLIPDALFNGRTFLEYPLAAAGNCAKHRTKVLNENHAFAAGFGVSSVAISWYLRNIVAKYTGVEDSVFVNEAIATSVSFYFIILANFTRKLKLPGDQPGIDYFYPTRKLVEEASLKLQEKFTNVYQGKGDIDWYRLSADNVLKKLNSTPALIVRRLLLEDSLQDYYLFAQRASSRQYLEHAKGDIANALEAALAMRSDWFYKGLNKCKKILPSVLGSERKQLALVMDKHIKAPLNDWLRFFRDPYTDPGAQAMPAEEGTYQRLLEAPVAAVLPVKQKSRVEVLDDDEKEKKPMRDPSYSALLSQPGLGNGVRLRK